MKPSDYLKKGWCQGRAAQDDEGRFVLSGSPSAACWCLLGACSAAYHSGGTGIDPVSFAIKARHLGIPSLVLWNDAPGRTQAEVVALMEKLEQEAE